MIVKNLVLRLSVLLVAVFVTGVFCSCDSNSDDGGGSDSGSGTEQVNPGGADGIVKILCIGNSFSVDAVEQNLHELFSDAGMRSVIGNLYIGGCTLETHYNNAVFNYDAYSYRKIPVSGTKVTTADVSMLTGILDEDWDYISLQQASPVSGMYSSYEPYLPFLVDYVKNNATNEDMQLVFHQTWAYGSDYTNSSFANYNYDQLTMYYAIMDAVQSAVKDNGIKIVVPSGTAVQNGRNSTLGDTFNRDGRHLNYTYGRYTAACAWFETLTGIDVTTTSYAPSDVDATTKDIVTHAAHYAVQNPYSINPMTAYGGSEQEEQVKTTGVIHVSQIDACPTTVTASWNVDNCIDDIAKDYPYTVELYKDASCTDLQVSWSFPNDPSNLWKPGSTARVYFTFAGLEPSTDYWLTICDTDDEAICTAEPVKLSTTAAFATTVTATENAAVGDVIVVQDFDKLINGGDSANKAVGVEPAEGNRSTLAPHEGSNPEGFEFVHFNTAGFSPFPLSATGVGLEYTQAVGLGDWCCGKSTKGTSVRTRPGFIQLGSKSSSAYLGYIGTPVLSAIPEGKTATVKVEFKARPFKYGSTYYCQTMSVAVADNVTVTSDTLQVSDWGTSKDSGTYIENKTIDLTQEDEWKDYTVELTGVTNTSRIRFASVETSRAQVLLDNIVITVTALQ